MVSRPSTLAELIDAVLDERERAVTFSADEIDAQARLLRQNLDQLRAALPARRSVLAALGALPAERRKGWLEGVQSAVKVVAGEAKRSSRILVDAARDLLPAAPFSWSFTAAGLPGAMKPAFELMSASVEGPQVTSVEQGGAIARSVAVDDSGSEPRILASIDNFPVGERAPVLLIVEDAPAAREPLVVELDAEVSAEPGPDAKGLRLTYAAALPAGAYYVFFGNPRNA
jgi:hypothetical protein